MEEKQKFLIVIIALAVLLVSSFFVNFKTYNLKITAEREKNDLKNENSSLSMKIEAFQKEKQQLEDRLNLLNNDLNKTSQQKEELQRQIGEIQRQYELVLRERDELTERLKTQLQPQSQAQAPKIEPVFQTEDAYWAGILRAKTELESQLENVRNALRTTQIDNEQIKREKSALELDLSNLIMEKKGLEQQLASLDSMSLELVKEKNMKLRIQEDLKSIKKENTILRQQLRLLNKSKGALENKLQQVQEEKTVLDRRFNEMSILLENRLSQMGGLKQRLDTLRGEGRGSEAVDMPPQTERESVELPPIIVRTSQDEAYLAQEQEAQSIQTPILAKILSVDKENNFVIIDLGEDAGIKVGDSFQVYRQEKRIATVEVIQVRRSIAACDIKEEFASVRAGDIIK